MLYSNIIDFKLLSVQQLSELRQEIGCESPQSFIFKDEEELKSQLEKLTIHQSKGFVIRYDNNNETGTY